MLLCRLGVEFYRYGEGARVCGLEQGKVLIMLPIHPFSTDGHVLRPGVYIIGIFATHVNILCIWVNTGLEIKNIYIYICTRYHLSLPK